MRAGGVGVRGDERDGRSRPRRRARPESRRPVAVVAIERGTSRPCQAPSGGRTSSQLTGPGARVGDLVGCSTGRACGVGQRQFPASDDVPRETRAGRPGRSPDSAGPTVLESHLPPWARWSASARAGRSDVARGVDGGRSIHGVNSRLVRAPTSTARRRRLRRPASPWDGLMRYAGRGVLGPRTSRSALCSTLGHSRAAGRARRSAARASLFSAVPRAASRAYARRAGRAWRFERSVVSAEAWGSGTTWRAAWRSRTARAACEKLSVRCRGSGPCRRPHAGHAWTAWGPACCGVRAARAHAERS
ncbi:conserved hypothetical protein [Cellulomonas flavigena DSM 20109]|uniref:Uncharacterized protein n=1 Tax=Cellulomonas flavigena (strain ATCC 482 / DSM 20109 / BCRC 11376 / JCM 18109 / NBRC 3775 / NCIMB 8073 / NRS 134) TaxID=446466 RepID=D5UEB7_CELFN|nr:conserved hypothetical protein [Cellulomonas flavigena DSM 20109]